ncbi:hypothetical protein FRC07_003641 [Ceratobasidium sp. 392]|nr:hypothetical protein FRC07_003641 [Ceratobasidium sp. 392]
MVRFLANSALFALASVLVAHGLPAPGQYEIPRNGNALAMSNKLACVVNAQAKRNAEPFKTALKHGSSSGWFSLQSANNGNYLQYRDGLGMVYDEASPVGFALMPGDKPDSFKRVKATFDSIMTKGGNSLGLENGVGKTFLINQAPGPLKPRR